MINISIIIPAHNEAERILPTLQNYYHFFKELADQQTIAGFELIVVLNGCNDNTGQVVNGYGKKYPEIRVIDMVESGKGLAVKTGFIDALKRPNDLIGFVDADMATRPAFFYDLVREMGVHDAAIASRYMPGAYVYPTRSFVNVKVWGRKIFYHTLIRLLFNLNMYDYQCGAKLFKRQTLSTILEHLTARQWSFDVELLYLTRLFGFSIIEVPTTWFDQTGSKLTVMNAGMKMLVSLFEIKKRHKKLANNRI